MDQKKILEITKKSKQSIKEINIEKYTCLEILDLNGNLISELNEFSFNFLTSHIFKNIWRITFLKVKPTTEQCMMIDLFRGWHP